MESSNGLQFNHCPLNHCPLLHGFAHLTVHIILKLHSGTAVTGRALNLGGGGGMRQRKLGSHTPPCHRRMVITTSFNVMLAALQRRPVLYHTR